MAQLGEGFFSSDCMSFSLLHHIKVLIAFQSQVSTFKLQIVKFRLKDIISSQME